MRFLTRAPPPVLNAVVRELWLLDDDGVISAGLPKPYVELVVSLKGDHWWRATQDGPEHLYRQGWVTPLQHAPRYARADGGRRLMGARLEPWLATALFGPLAIGDGQPPPHLASLIGPDADHLQAALRSSTDTDDGFSRFGDWLVTHVAMKAAAISVCTKATSKRSARRHYARDVGASPKRWQLLHRLDRVLRDPDLRDPGQSLAQLAVEHGFADQPHFNRQILSLTGTTPARLRARSPKEPPHLVRQD